MTRKGPYKGQTVAVDFDGVLHSYTSPWIAPEVIPDPPVPGAIEWLNEIVKHYRIIILTTRARTLEGRDAITKYLRDNGYTGKQDLVVSYEKLPSIIYIDDRGWRFEGTFPTAEEIKAALPWWKKLPQTVG